MNLTSVTIGQYYPSDSVVHRLDPRVKIVITLIMAVGIFAVTGFSSLAAVTLFIALVTALARIPPSWLLRGLRPLVIILVFTLALHLFLSSGPALARLGPLRLSRTGLATGLFVVGRLILLVLGTSLLTLTTSPIELTDGLEYLLAPLKAVRVPAHELAMMMTIALRFIPTLLLEVDRIMKAQMARGADFESGNILRRATNFVPLLIPLFIAVFRRADELALAMEARAYRGGEGRTRMRALVMRPADWAALVGVLGFSALVLAAGRTAPLFY